MKLETRKLWDGYSQRQAELNGVPIHHVNTHFAIAPSVSQTLEDKVQQSSEFLKQIGIFPVTEQEGEKLGLGVGGPVASTNASSTTRRDPRSVHTLDSDKFRCEQTNFDTFITYAQLDMWAKYPDFQQRITNQLVNRRALDRIMVGFNGISHADKSDLTANPLLQDVNIGWLQKYRANAPQRVMSGVTLTSRDESNKITAKGDYSNLDALVYDATSSLLDEWYKTSPDLVVITGRNIMTAREYPLINGISDNNPNSESLAGQLIVSRKTINNLPTLIAPFFPEHAMLVTSLRNLSIYWQEGKQRRMLKEEPEFNRISTYESSNDAYVIEDYGFGCLIENITWAEPAAGGE
ncbi:phage major capsid protein, P2 family [Pantoea sp. SORGH_AS_0659]|uniref:phage major capsid protein, P2 family n=1 Tax=Pantoea sp. SORGH_AS_0659 TaxID=3062597 RepID=UPI002857E359|nr:phage major capsid protein, P2 family [Pantoea sp. SORGH_AS_0659]MDR6348516.1 P2 family phage major capsid protein [Pantoea sp. SORGH_AS_0659]